MREQLLSAVKAHAQGEIAKHRANVNVYLEHPAGIGEHSDITEAIQVELDKIARYHDQVEVSISTLRVKWQPLVKVFQTLL